MIQYNCLGVINIKILNFGSCNIDYVYSMDHIVRVGETQSTYQLEIFPGGKGLNQSIAIARAGAAVHHAGCVGCDGDMLLELLQKKRCAVAAELLLQSEASIGEIAHSVGYENLSFFRRKFKETYGKNPLEYRKNRG